MDRSRAREDIVAVRRSMEGICEWTEHDTGQWTLGVEVDKFKGTEIFRNDFFLTTCVYYSNLVLYWL